MDPKASSVNILAESALVRRVVEKRLRGDWFRLRFREPLPR
jgi:hypothetical protein